MIKKFKSWNDVEQHLVGGSSIHCPTNTYWADHWYCYEGCCESDDYTLAEMMEWIQERADLEDLEYHE